MKRNLALINLLVPLALMAVLIFVPLAGFVVPPYLVTGLMLYTTARAFLLFQQQTLFVFLPLLLLALSTDLQWSVDIFAPFAIELFLLFNWVVNLQSGQRHWLHPWHWVNITLLISFIVFAMRLVPIPEPLLNYTIGPNPWLALFFATTPLLFITRWQRPGRLASYWPLLATTLLMFEVTEEEYVILWVTVSSMLSLTIDSYLMTYVDELTGILGRRALLFRMKTAGPKYTAVMVDVDHFKQFNDKHGHQIGDDVLKTVATLINKTAGATAYRYGGEEFTLLFAKGDPIELAPHVEATRERLANYDLYPKSGQGKKQQRGKTRKPKPLKITASFGMAQHRPGDEPEAVLERADKALYSAKANGRNRLVMAKPQKT